MSPKYPRTSHLPWSPGGTSDDRRMASVASLLGTPVIITEKMDGSNVCIEADGCYARSHAAAPNHPSFDAFKAFYAGVRNLLPGGLQVFGEWLYAKHSISYQALPGYFMVFGVRDLRTMTWGSWGEVEVWATELSSQTAPVLAQTTLPNEAALKTLTEKLAKLPSLCGGEREGVVVRQAGEFADANFSTLVGKFVRSNHVQTEDHWKTQAIVKNGIGPLG